MSNAGRPHTLDDVKRGQVCALIAAGASLAAAARYVGCSTHTIRREGLRNEEFRKELRNAEVRAQLTPLQALQNAAKSHWRAAAWLLERTGPEKFDRRGAGVCKPAELHAVVDAVIESAVDDIEDDQLREHICRRLMVAAYKAMRSLTAVERSRLTMSKGPFDTLTASEGDFEKLMAELERGRSIALRDLKRFDQNRANCA